MSAAAVARAVAGEDVDGITVECPSPGPLFDRVDTPLDERTDPWLRGALAAAARTRGERAPQRDRIEAERARLADHTVESCDLAAARRRVARTGAEEERLRERVAMLRGRVEALAEVGEAAAHEEAAAALDDAVRELTEAETERIAAEQHLDAVESRAREARDRRETRLRIEDRIANLERDARAHLADAVYEEFRAAVESLPGTGHAGDGPGEYEGEGLLAAMAAVRVADTDAPVVLATDRLGDEEEAAARLDAPVIRV